MLKRPAIFCASLMLAGVFALGLARLFELRFDRGDIYPPYSTLRTDPLGASVFYESLGRVPGVTARRYFEEAFKSDDGRAQALFVLGTGADSFRWLSRSELGAWQRFVLDGGRFVIAYCPQVSEPWSSPASQTNEAARHFPEGKKTRRGSHKEPGKSPDQKDQRHEDELEAEKRDYADLSAAWGFGIAYHSLGTNDDGQIEFPDAELVAPSPELPALLSIHTSLCFTNLTNGWRTVYQRDGQTPVVLERRWGAGSVVLAADAYPLSNEAMFKKPSAPLLAWLLGGGREAIFEEAYLGLAEEPGIATLVRRYRLHGLILSLLAAAGLFVWKNLFGLVPPLAAAPLHAGPVIAGRDSASGFVNLLRRSIAPAEIINVCFAEWKKSGPWLGAVSPAQRREVEELVQQQAALEPRRRQPVESYRAISRILQRQK
jgi:hypothetical protein